MFDVTDIEIDRTTHGILEFSRDFVPYALNQVWLPVIPSWTDQVVVSIEIRALNGRM